MSMDFQRIRAQVDHLITKYYDKQRDAEEHRTHETAAAIKIQRLWRGYIARKYLAFLHEQATTIKRVWRGYRGRLLARAMREYEKEVMYQDYYNTMATKIQKTFRGFLSRKHIHDFRRRKKYIQTVTSKGEQLNRTLSLEAEQRAKVVEIEKQNRQAKQFEALTERVHYLLSTSAIPGVYHSSHGEQFHKSAFGIPMDDHLRESAHNSYVKSQILKEMKRQAATTASKAATAAAVPDMGASPSPDLTSVRALNPVRPPAAVGAASRSASRVSSYPRAPPRASTSQSITQRAPSQMSSYHPGVNVQKKVVNKWKLRGGTGSGSGSGTTTTTTVLPDIRRPASGGGPVSGRAGAVLPSLVVSRS